MGAKLERVVRFVEYDNEAGGGGFQNAPALCWFSRNGCGQICG